MNQPTYQETCQGSIQLPIDRLVSDMQGKTPGNADFLIPAYEPAAGEQPEFTDILDTQLDALATFQPEAYEHASRLQEQLDEPTQNVDSLRCIVAIPVASHQEHESIFGTLEHYASQTLSTNAFEIVLHLNYTDNGEDGNEKAAKHAQTYAEVERFRQQHPDIAVRTISSVYRGNTSIGLIRADMWNTIALDMQRRGRTERIPIISNDCDTTAMHRAYLQRLSDEFEATGSSLITTRLKWQLVPELGLTAMANRVLRYQMFIDNIRDLYSGKLRPPDQSTAISLDDYLTSGGFNPAVRLGEMKDAVARIRDYRERVGGSAPVESRCYDVYVTSDSRRLVQTMAMGRMPYAAWRPDVLPFEIDDPVRGATVAAVRAEAEAQLHGHEWAEEISATYLGCVEDEAKRTRLQQAAYHILQLS